MDHSLSISSKLPSCRIRDIISRRITINQQRSTTSNVMPDEPRKSTERRRYQRQSASSPTRWVWGCSWFRLDFVTQLDTKFVVFDVREYSAHDYMRGGLWLSFGKWHEGAACMKLQIKRFERELNLRVPFYPAEWYSLHYNNTVIFHCLPVVLLMKAHGQIFTYQRVHLPYCNSRVVKLQPIYDLTNKDKL